MVDRERKRELLSHLITTGRIDQALVFTRTKHGANRLALQLEKDGIAATAIHGNKSQPQRVRALADFKAGRFAILVATEVAARGLDIEALPHVVNFELPMVPEDYVHRIGRTGRAGVDGDAVSLVCVDELKLLNDIERVLGRGIPRETIAGFEPDPRIRPEPILRGGLGGARPSRAMSGIGAPRHGGAPRSGGQATVRSATTRRSSAPGGRAHGRARRSRTVRGLRDRRARHRLDRRTAVVAPVAHTPGIAVPASPVRDGQGRGSATARDPDPRPRLNTGRAVRARSCRASASPGRGVGRRAESKGPRSVAAPRAIVCLFSRD